MIYEYFNKMTPPDSDKIKTDIDGHATMDKALSKITWHENTTVKRTGFDCSIDEKGVVTKTPQEDIPGEKGVLIIEMDSELSVGDKAELDKIVG